MAKSRVDREVRKAILDARQTMQEAEKADCNEAEVRRRIERIFESIMGYDAFKHLSRERAVRGAGEAEYVDFAIQLESGPDVKPEIMVEIKRVSVDLAPKHLRQVSSYAINAGCEWILLTNGREWRLYHVTFGQPPVTKLIHAWNLLTDEVEVLAERFDLVSYKSLRKNTLEDVWRKTSTLNPRNLLQAILSHSSISVLRRELRRGSKVMLSPEDIVAGFRRLLNEAALAEMENIRLSLTERRTRRKKKSTKKAESVEDCAERSPVTQPPADPNARAANEQATESER
jgi:hypothetical protein